MESIQYPLPQDHIPRTWYNIACRSLWLVLHPGTLKSIGPDDLGPGQDSGN
jgi:hypothetical protein